MIKLKIKRFWERKKVQIQIKYQKIQTYINHKKYIFKLGSCKVFADYQIKVKVWKIFELLSNIVVTGIVVKYILDYRNFFSYGLGVLLGTHYLDIVIQIIKKPYKNKDDATNNAIYDK